MSKKKQNTIALNEQCLHVVSSRQVGFDFVRNMEKEKSKRNCPQCFEPYSDRRTSIFTIDLRSKCFIIYFCVSAVPQPDQRDATRGGLPLILLCWHGICYSCVMSRQSSDRNGSANDFSKFHCKVCNTNNPIQLEALHQDVLGAVNWCKLQTSLVLCNCRNSGRRLL